MNIKKIFMICIIFACGLRAEPETLVHCTTDKDCADWAASPANIYRKCSKGTVKCITKTIGFSPSAVQRNISYCACTNGPMQEEPLRRYATCNSAKDCHEVSCLSGAQPLCDKDDMGICYCPF